MRWRPISRRAKADIAAMAALAAAVAVTAVAMGPAPARLPAASRSGSPAAPARPVIPALPQSPVPVASPAPAASPPGGLPAAEGLRAYSFSGTGLTFTEGDGTYTLRLLDGRVVWFFADSFLGKVQPGGGRGQSSMLHNQIVVQDSPAAAGAASFHNVWPNGWGTNAFAAPGCMAEWPAAAIQPAPSQVQVVLRCVASGETVVRLDLATLTINSGFTGWTVRIDTSNFDTAARLQSLPCFPQPGSAPVDFGQSVMQVAGLTYIYGVQHCTGSVHAYVARVPGSDLSLTGSWEYWDGSSRGWVTIGAGGQFYAAPMTSGGVPLVHAGSEYSVVYDAARGVYRMIATDLGLGPNVDEYTATASPAGPWVFGGIIDSTQADGIYGSKPVADPGSACTLTTYGAKEQPAFETGGDIVFSVNVNVAGCPPADAEAAYRASLANYDPVFRYS